MNNVVTTQRDGPLAIVTVDNPPVNALSQAVRVGIAEAIIQAGKDPEVKAIVLICAGRTFMAGADITEFGKPPLPPERVTATRWCWKRSWHSNARVAQAF